MSPAPPAPAGSATAHGPHWPALDGLRGLAVSAVMAYHLHHISGGFLGVDLFFVLSGFLITSLLVREGERRGRIDLKRFWIRRGRRLLPALAVTVVGVVLLARLFLDHGTLDALRGDALATAAYVANWRFAAQPVGGYFAADPSPLRHAWSLAIEEQYYIVWPFVVFGTLALARRLRVPHGRVVGVIAASGVAASATWTALHAGTWGIERLYLGTDTRLMAPLTGATLACVLRRRPELADPSAASRRIRVAATALAASCVMALGVAVVTVSAQDEFLYRGGFLLIALICAGAVTGSVVGGAGVTGHALALPPLRWLGERSYGLYLYSWPIQVFAESQDLDGATLTLTTLALAGVVAEASYRWLEMPIRRGHWPGIHRPARRPTTAPVDALAAASSMGSAPIATARTRSRTPIAIAGIVLLVIGVVVVGTITSAEPDRVAQQTDDEQRAKATRPPVSVPDGPTTTGPGGEIGPVRVMVAGDSVGVTLGDYAPRDIDGVSSVDARGLFGCGLLVEGSRPAKANSAGPYDICAGAIDDADRNGLAGKPDVVLLVTGAWEREDHERKGRTVGPGDTGWTDEIRRLLDARIERLGSGGATVAVWAEPCGADEDRRRRQRWYTNEVLEPVVAAREDAVIVSPAEVVCRDGLARDDIDGVGDPRPDDGQHWSEDGAAWLWRTWLGPTLHDVAADAATAEARPDETPEDDGPPPATTMPLNRPVNVRVAGDSIAFTLDYEGQDGARDAGVSLVPGTSTIGCGLVRDGRSWDGERDLAVDCGGVAEREVTVVRQSPADITIALWGAWEMAGASGLPEVGFGRPGNPEYDAYVREQLVDRLGVLASDGSTVAVLGVDCWPEANETRSAERVEWWRDLSRSVARELDVPYLDPTEFLCENGEPRNDIPGVGDPRPGDGAHWGETGADWFWREWLGPQIHSLAGDR